MPITYTPIATTTLGSAASSVTFSSIAGTYTDLVLIAQLRSASSTATDTRIASQFNGDTGSNYSITELVGDGSSASSVREANRTIIDNALNTAKSNQGFSVNIYNLMNYSNSTTYKTMLIRENTPQAYSTSVTGSAASVGLWRSTAAITSIALLRVTAFDFDAGSTFTLYGIKAA